GCQSVAHRILGASTPLDAEYPLFEAVGTRRHRAHVCDAIRASGLGRCPHSWAGTSRPPSLGLGRGESRGAMRGRRLAWTSRQPSIVVELAIPDPCFICFLSWGGRVR